MLFLFSCNKSTAELLYLALCSKKTYQSMKHAYTTKHCPCMHKTSPVATNAMLEEDAVIVPQYQIAHLTIINDSNEQLSDKSPFMFDPASLGDPGGWFDE